jgi:hypothetical protein
MPQHKPDQEQPVRLEGSVTTFPLRELVEMVMYSSVTGVLEVHTHDGPGSMFFRDGHAYHAAFGEKTGLEAARSLFLDTEARFLFAADITSEAETIWMDPIEMLDHCESMAQRLARTRALVPGLAWVPAIVRDHAAQVSIAEDDWPLLAAIDGQRNVEEVAAEVACDIVEVCESLHRMIERDLVRISPPTRRAAETPLSKPSQAKSAAGAPARRSFFERLIESLPEQELSTPTPTPTPALEAAPSVPAGPTPDDDPILKLLRGTK